MIDEDGDIKPPSQFWDMGVVGIAAVLTMAGIATCFFSFDVHGDKTPAKQPTEVTVGIGTGSTIHPASAPSAGH
jgi:hypothetical protein